MTTAVARRQAMRQFLIAGFMLYSLRPASPAEPGLSDASHRSGGAVAAADRLRQVAAALAARWKVEIVVDPTLVPSRSPRIPADDLPIDQALDAALAPLRGVTWRRVHLMLDPKEALPPPETLSAAARALEQPPVGALLIENRLTKRGTLYLKDQPVSTALQAIGVHGKPVLEPITVIYGTAAGRDSGTPERQFADLQRQQMQMEVPPEQRALAMVQMLQLMQAMPPASREQFAQRTLQAGMRVWESTPPEQRQEMIRQTVQLMHAFDAAPRGAGNPAGRPAPHPDGPAPAPPQGEKLAAALAARYDGLFLAEPALPLSPPVELPDAALPVDKALQAVTAAQPGIAWRRLSLTEAQLKRMPSTAGLAAAVRTLETLEAGSLLLENPATQRGTLYLKDQPLSTLAPALEAARFAERPVYLLYTTTPAARGGTVLERFADLQRQQMGMMLQMGPDQMTRSMEQAIQTFQSGDDATRARLMGLPVIAGMMAVWFPQEAKERGTVTP